jgi:hypothetical protein
MLTGNSILYVNMNSLGENPSWISQQYKGFDEGRSH